VDRVYDKQDDTERVCILFFCLSNKSKNVYPQGCWDRTPPLREPQADAAWSLTDGDELRNRLSFTEPSGSVL